MRDDHYRILGLEHGPGEAIVSKDLRQAYKQALLRSHPDKQTMASRSDKDLDGTTPTIDEITKAYEILDDPKLRAEYDKQRQRYRDVTHETSTHHTGMETVDLEVLDFDNANASWSKSCRCGSRPAFVIMETELEKNIEYGELVTGCKGCSLWLRILFGVADQ